MSFTLCSRMRSSLRSGDNNLKNMFFSARDMKGTRFCAKRGRKLRAYAKKVAFMKDQVIPS